jgi:iron complex outermembrane receptor protein
VVVKAIAVVPVLISCASLDLHAEAPPQGIETIEVEGTRLDLNAVRAAVAEVPGGVSLVDVNDLRARNVASLADLLRYVPGVWAASDSGTDDIFFSSRGSNLDATDYDMNGIKLMQDGLPVTAADGSNHNRVVDPLSARYATVARGANALTYGASTLGGAIDFTTPRARDVAPLELAMSGGSFGERQARASASIELGARADVLVTLEGKDWDGYRDHNEQKRRGIYGNVGWRMTNDVTTRLFATYVDNDQELPSSLSRAQLDDDPDQANPNALDGNFQINVETWRIANKTSWRIDDDRLLDVGVSIERQDLYHPIVQPIIVNDVEVFSLLIDTELQTTGTSMRYRHTSGSHELTIGGNYGVTEVNGGNYRNSHGDRNGRREIVDDDADSLELFVIDRWSLTDRFALTVGAQWVRASREAETIEVDTGAATNPGDDYSSINPRIGVTYMLEDGVSVFANVSRLFEPPTNFELEDDLRGGDDALKAMKGTVVEAGTRGVATLGARIGVEWDAAIYYAWIEDEILSVDDPDAPGTSLSANVDRTVHAGFEAVLGVDAPLDAAARHHLTSHVAVTFNEFSFDGDPRYGHNTLPAAPEHVLRGEVLYRHANGFYAGPTFDIVGDRYADFANGFDVRSYELVGLRVGFDRDTWRVFAEGQNLLDEEYVATHRVRDIAAPNAAILNPGAPRALFVGFEARL